MVWKVGTHLTWFYCHGVSVFYLEIRGAAFSDHMPVLFEFLPLCQSSKPCAFTWHNQAFNHCCWFYWCFKFLKGQAPLCVFHHRGANPSAPRCLFKCFEPCSSSKNQATKVQIWAMVKWWHPSYCMGVQESRMEVKARYSYKFILKW